MFYCRMKKLNRYYVFMETDKLTLRVTWKSNSPRIILFILKKRKNAKALTEKNISYETIIMIENLVVALFRTTGIFFTGCCECCSYCWFLHRFSVGLLLGKESWPNRECLGDPTPCRAWPRAVTVAEAQKHCSLASGQTLLCNWCLHFLRDRAEARFHWKVHSYWASPSSLSCFSHALTDFSWMCTLNKFLAQESSIPSLFL